MKTITVLVLFSCLVFGLGQSNGADDDFVHQWCQRTTYEDLCKSIVGDDPRVDLKNSPNGLCMILRDGAVTTAFTTAAKISDALQKTSQLYARQCLQDCSDGYSRATNSLKSADFTVMNRQNHLGLTSIIGSADSEARDCEECFKERPGTLPSPVTAENSHLIDICSTILEIISLNDCDKITGCT